MSRGSKVAQRFRSSPVLPSKLPTGRVDVLAAAHGDACCDEDADEGVEVGLGGAIEAETLNGVIRKVLMD